MSDLYTTSNCLICYTCSEFGFRWMITWSAAFVNKADPAVSTAGVKLKDSATGVKVRLFSFL